MYTFPRLMQGTALSLFLTGCAGQQAAPQRPQVPVEPTKVQPPASPPPSAPPINCAAAADVVAALNKISYRGDTLNRLAAGNIFAMAGLTGGQAIMADGARDRFVADLQAARAHLAGQVTASPEHKATISQVDEILTWLKQGDATDEVHFDCLDGEGEQVEGLTVPKFKFSVSPFTRGNTEHIINLFGHYGLRLQENEMDRLGGRVLNYSYEPDSPHLIWIHTSVGNGSDLNTYSESLKWSLRHGLQRLVVMGYTGDLSRLAASVLDPGRVRLFAAQPSNPEQVWRSIQQSDDSFTRQSATAYILYQALQANPYEFLGLDLSGANYLSQRLAHYAYLAYSVYNRRFLAMRLLQMKRAGMQHVAAELKKPLPSHAKLRIIRYEAAANMKLLLLRQALQQEQLSFIIVEAK